MATTDKVKKTSPSKMSAKERRAAVARQRQRNQQILLGIGALVLLGGVLLVIYLNNRPVEAVVAPDSANRYQEFTQQKLMGTTADGYPFLGAETAPVVVEAFESFSCPACKSYHETMFANMIDLFKAGKAKWVHVPIVTTGSYDPTGQARGAICAMQQGKFWDIYDVMWDWQTRYGPNSNDYRRLTQAAGTIGLDTGKFTACLDSAETKALIDKAKTYAEQKGMTATPTILVNGVKVYPPASGNAPSLSEMRGLIEAQAAGKQQ
jgi:protein-disulfide isomerase